MHYDNLAPVCFFVYNRLSETKQSIEALSANFLALKSDLIVFSDGPKNAADEIKVNAVRDYLKRIKGFKSILIVESETNAGLANSIITGVNKVINKYGRVIVLEDDLVSSRNFLNFMNQALDFFESKNKICSISGFSFNFPYLNHYSHDYYFGLRSSSWGWATWLDRWSEIDWDLKDYSEFKSSFFKKRQFRRGGSDLPGMLNDQMTGRINSWAIRFCYHQYKHNQLTVIPSISKIQSIGFTSDATHTHFANRRFIIRLDNGEKIKFTFTNHIIPDSKLLSLFRAEFSWFNRFKNYIARVL